MMRLLLALVLCVSAACCASAAAPVDDYIATRDAYLKQFNDSDIIADEPARAAHERARDDLEDRLRRIIGPSRIAGFPADGKINLDSLAEGFHGFGLLDGLVYASTDNATRIVVTTRELLDKWLAVHRTWWDGKDDIPPGVEAALKSESFFTQALSTDAHFYRFVDIPIRRPADTTFAFAALVGRAQDVGLETPREVVVTLLRGGRAYVIVARAAVVAASTPQCVQSWKKAEAQALRAQEKSDELSERAYRAYLGCFAAQAPRRGYFPALLKPAQGLIEALPK
jgi:hypothetical protein